MLTGMENICMHTLRYDRRYTENWNKNRKQSAKKKGAGYILYVMVSLLQRIKCQTLLIWSYPEAQQPASAQAWMKLSKTVLCKCFLDLSVS